MFHKHKEEKKHNGFTRMVRTFTSITLISTFVIGVTYGVKYLSETDPNFYLQNSLESLPTNSKIGQVTGALTEKLEENRIENVESSDVYTNEYTSQNSESLNYADISTQNSYISSFTDSSANMSNIETKVAVLADSHGDIPNLTKALDLASSENVDAVVHLGDHTDLGLINDLNASFNTLSLYSMPFYAIPGDRDLWETRDASNFKKIFGNNNHIFELNGYNFLVFDNSMNFTEISKENITFFENNIDKVDFVFLSQPLYHPNNKVMGFNDGSEISLVNAQAKLLLEKIRQSNVKAVFAAEHHISFEALDPMKNSLTHYTTGAITSVINDIPQSILQAPRFSVLNIMSDGTFSVEEVLL